MTRDRGGERAWVGGLMLAATTFFTGAGALGQSHGATGPYMALRPPRTSAGLTPESVRRVVTRNHDTIVRCYSQLLTAEPTARGVLSVRLDVIAGGFGLVSRVHFSRRNAAFETCMHGVMGQIAWPAPRNAPTSEVNLQLDFAPTAPVVTARR